LDPYIPIKTAIRLDGGRFHGNIRLLR
jgi:hypothetical protein